MSANAMATRSPASASHSTKFACGRKPIATATPNTNVIARTVWTRLPTTCPVRTDTRAIAMVRKRSTMPSVMSIAIEMLVPCTAAVIAIRMIVGVT